MEPDGESNSLTLLLPTPAAQIMIYIIIQSRTATMITEIEFLLRFNMAQKAHTYTIRKS